MGFSKEDAIARAQSDLIQRLGVADGNVKVASVDRADFSDMALGASVEDEMSGQMITSGWRIKLSAEGHGTFEYRANEDQVRLYDFQGANYRL